MPENSITLISFKGLFKRKKLGEDEGFPFCFSLFDEMPVFHMLLKEAFPFVPLKAVSKGLVNLLL